MMNLKQKLFARMAGVSTALMIGAVAVACKADDLADISSSTAAGIKTSRDATLSLFFQNLPVIVLGVLAVALTLWGIFLLINRITRHK